MSESKVSVLNKYQANKSLRTKIKKSFPKPVLCTPYKIIWPSVNSKTQGIILSTLTKFFKDNDFKIPCIDGGALKSLSHAEKKAKRTEHRQTMKQSAAYKLRRSLAIGINEVTRMLEGNMRVEKRLHGGEEEEGEEKKEIEENEEGGKILERNEKEDNIGMACISEIANEDERLRSSAGDMLTNADPSISDELKGLQNEKLTIKNNNYSPPKKVLSILFVDRSSPWQLHRHLIQMAALAKCPAVAVDQLSERIAPLLSLTKLCALGFKAAFTAGTGGHVMVDASSNKNNDDDDGDGDDHDYAGLFGAVVDALKPLCPIIALPWRQSEESFTAIEKACVVGGQKEGACAGGGGDAAGDDDDAVDDGDDDEAVGDGDDDTAMKEDASAQLSYSDVHIRVGVNDEEYRQLLSLRRKSAFMEKDFERMLFNYAPHKASFRPPPVDMASVFYVKKVDARLGKKKTAKEVESKGEVCMGDQMKGFVSLEDAASAVTTSSKKRKRNITDDVVKKVQKNEFKKKRTK